MAHGEGGPSESAEQISQGKQDRRKITHRGKTLRAFRAYVDLLETTAYMQKEMQSQLEAFDVTMRTIRILEMLYRKGPMAIRVMARQMKCSRQNIKNILRPLRERGWVVLEMGTQPPVPKDESRLPVGEARRQATRESYRDRSADGARDFFRSTRRW